jgi:starch synthase
MRILTVASEAVPFAKTGGLADVIGALPVAVARLGHDVDVVMPRYRGITAGEESGRVTVRLGGQVADARVWIAGDRGPIGSAPQAGAASQAGSAPQDRIAPRDTQPAASRQGSVRTIFIDYPAYYDRDFLYGTAGQDYPDNPERFAFLAAAALEWAASVPERYDVVHGHDWQAGLMPMLLRTGRAPSSLKGMPAVFTIHNLAYQGVFDASWLPRLGFGWDLMRIDALEYWGRISYLKSGLMFSDVITTVSPRYARETQTPEFGFGFDGILRYRSDDVVGILNGIDYDQWDPARDPYIPEHYDARNLSGKLAAKRTLIERFGLAAGAGALERPLVGLISRLVDQKGFDLIAEIADELVGLDASFVLLGNGERRYEDLWLALAARHPDRVAVKIGFDEPLAHLIEAGADLFLMPSRFEPCGLNQMYSLRYGTVPLVRAVGGLVDTVRNYNPRTGEGTGFSFDDYSAQALLNTLVWALGIYRDRAAWQRIQRAGMQQDFSWDASARQYVKVYARATGSVEAAL